METKQSSIFRKVGEKVGIRKKATRVRNSFNF